MKMNMSIPSVSVTYESTGKSKKSNELGMREMQERVYEKRGEQYLIIKSPTTKGRSRIIVNEAKRSLNIFCDDKAIAISPIPSPSIKVETSKPKLAKPAKRTKTHKTVWPRTFNKLMADAWAKFVSFFLLKVIFAQYPIHQDPHQPA